jgi:hypothetical protein
LRRLAKRLFPIGDFGIAPEALAPILRARS